jgi:hypothetical protein
MTVSEDRDSTDARRSATFYNFLVLGATITLWIICWLNFPTIDGVSVYDLLPVFPDTSQFIQMKDTGKTSTHEVFAAEASLLDYCVFPDVYNKLIVKDQTEISQLLQDNGVSVTAKPLGAWQKLDFDAMKTTGTEFNLPYDGLVVPAGKPEMSSQYFHPTCRCINKVLNIYKATKQTTDRAEFGVAKEQVQNCLKSRHLIKRQTLIGDTAYENTEIKNRKYISRFAMLFQLSLAYFFGYFYNLTNFASSITDCKDVTNNLYYAMIFLIPILAWLANVFAVDTVAMGITYGTTIMGPALVVFIAVEFMWSWVAKLVDIGRQTFMHPLAFYIALVSMYTIALIENGVFTLSVILTYVFMSNATAMAYAGVLFASHGSIWKNSTSSCTGFILLIFLSGTMALFHLAPTFPVNCGINSLWITPVVFSVFVYSKILFIDHLLNDEKDVKNTKFRVTHSTHMFNKAYMLLIALVVLYFASDITSMAFGMKGNDFISAVGGRLTKRLNFELAEVGALKGGYDPFYDHLTTNTQFYDRLYVNP